MAKLPQYQPGNADLGRVGFYPVRHGVESGAAIESVGHALTQMGESFAIDIKNRNDRVQQWQAEKGLMTFEQDQSQKLAKAHENISEGGVGFYDSINTQLKDDKIGRAHV